MSGVGWAIGRTEGDEIGEVDGRHVKGTGTEVEGCHMGR